VGDEVGEEGRAALGVDLYRVGGEPTQAPLDVPGTACGAPEAGEALSRSKSTSAAGVMANSVK